MTKVSKENFDVVKAERDFYKDLSNKYADLIRNLLNHAAQSNH